MSSHPPPPNALAAYLARIAPPPEPRSGETFIRATPRNPIMAFLDERAPAVHDAIRGGTRAVQRAVSRPGSPINALTQVMGDPLSSISGPSGAIAGFATRNAKNAARFADPGFHNFILKHGPKRGFFSQLRDYAPEGVIEDLWQKYGALKDAEKAKFAARHAPVPGVRSMSRAGSPRNALLDVVDPPQAQATWKPPADYVERLTQGPLRKQAVNWSALKNKPPVVDPAFDEGVQLVRNNNAMYVVGPADQTGNQAVHGILRFKEKGGRVTGIDHFVLSSNLQGRGLGQKLLSAAEEQGFHITDDILRGSEFSEAGAGSVNKYLRDKYLRGRAMTRADSPRAARDVPEPPLAPRGGPAEWWAAADAQRTEYELRAAANRAAREARRNKKSW